VFRQIKDLKRRDILGEREKETERDRERDRDRDTHTHRETQRSEDIQKKDSMRYVGVRKSNQYHLLRPCRAEMKKDVAQYIGAKRGKRRKYPAGEDIRGKT
jgi:hypothetical protein